MDQPVLLTSSCLFNQYFYAVILANLWYTQTMCYIELTTQMKSLYMYSLCYQCFQVCKH